ncbi:hypothetical protein ES708_29316 [subsurface metagenome]
MTPSFKIDIPYRLDRLPGCPGLGFHIRLEGAYCFREPNPPGPLDQPYQRQGHWYPLGDSRKHHPHRGIAWATRETPRPHPGQHPFAVHFPHMLSNIRQQISAVIGSEAAATLATVGRIHLFHIRLNNILSSGL